MPLNTLNKMGFLRSIINGLADSLPFVASAKNSVKKEELQKSEDLPLLNKILKSVDFVRLITMLVITFLLLRSVFKVQNITFEQLLELIKILI